MTPFDYFQVRAEKGKGHDSVEKLQLIGFWTTNLGKSDYMTLSLDWRCICVALQTEQPKVSHR